MRTKLVYEDFKRNLPSETMQAKHRAELHEQNMAQFKKQVERIDLIRKERAPYRKALMDFFDKEKLFNHLPPLPKPDPKGAKRRFGELKAPNVLRLKRRIFKHGSILLNDVPSGQNPFVGWIGTSVPGLSPSNDAEGWGSYNNVDSVSMGVSAGEGLNGNAQSGGSAACWGYIGEYFTPADPCPDTEVIEAQIEFSASPSIYCNPNWTTTFNPFFPLTDYAQLTINVNLICLIYDNAWNYATTMSSTPFNIINPVDQFTGSNNYGGVGFNLSPPLGPLTVPVSLSNNYGFFVQFYMFASGNGESTGAWVPGSNADALLNGVVPSLQFNALWNS
jgi:hypothetical protein